MNEIKIKKICDEPVKNQKSLIVFLVVLGVVLLGLIYASIGQFEFLNWDDDIIVLNNPLLKVFDWAHIKTIFSQVTNRTYTPLTIFSFAVDRAVGGYNPALFHWHNVFLHTVNFILIALLGYRFGLKWEGAIFAAMLFAVHPMHVESVAWITERKDVLYVLFYLAAMLQYQSYLRERHWTKFCLVVVFAFLSILAKPMAMTLPVILLLMDGWYRRKWTANVFKEKIVVCLFLVPVVWISIVANMGLIESGYQPVFELSLGQRILIWIWSLVFYLKQFLMPLQLSHHYFLPEPVTIFNEEYLKYLGIFIIGIVMIYRWRKQRWLILALGYFLISILPVLRDKTAVTHVVADRFMYLPSLGFCFLLGFIFQSVYYSSDKNYIFLNKFIMIILLFYVSALSIQSQAYVRIWKNNVTFWEYVYNLKPQRINSLMCIKLGEAYHKRSDFKKMVRLYHRGDIDGLAYIQNIIDLYNKALKIQPGNLYAIKYLNQLYADIGADKRVEE